MHPQAILDDLAACGIAPRLTPDGCGIALPAGQLNPAQRTAITANKAALIEFLRAIGLSDHSDWRKYPRGLINPPKSSNPE